MQEHSQSERASLSETETQRGAAARVRGQELYDSVYDPVACMIRVPFQSPGYHSKVPDGTLVHPTNPSLLYALELLFRNDAAADERACSIIRKVLPLQDKDPVSKTYGIWPWLYEEPLSMMAPPDWNWADFCGFRLATILVKAESRLPGDLRDEVKDALFHAAGAIYRRNVGAHYTNICVMGGIVSTLAGEILNEERMIAYGRQRLADVVAHHRRDGGFSEYNSPTYTRVVLWDCEVARTCIKDREALASVDYLFHHAWKTLADHFHPATGQWAGPHSRDYTSFMTQEMSRYIAFKTGVNVRVHPRSPVTTKVAPLVGWIVEDDLESSTAAPVRRSALFFDPSAPTCPPDLSDRFRRLPRSEYEIRERYIRREPEETSTCGVTWMHEEICLGSVNRDFFMDQRRAVVAYWNNGQGIPVTLRLRFMHDGREFASACVSNAQSGPRLLSAVHLLLDQGDFHPTLDRPANSIFHAEDFRLRYELRGDGVDVHDGRGGTFLLSAGDWSAVITPAAGSFAGAPVAWKITRGDGWVAVDGVCYEGPKKEFSFRNLPLVRLAAGLHLERGEKRSGCGTIEFQEQAGRLKYRLCGLEVSVPDRATPMFPEI
jgi:hypothetical protein